MPSCYDLALKKKICHALLFDSTDLVYESDYRKARHDWLLLKFKNNFDSYRNSLYIDLSLKVDLNIYFSFRCITKSVARPVC
ncbi:hypothetical protein LP43_2117 [Methylophaga thiooxydans]|uniref:Uncharacterized protein n=1 Tax=Methylophaga thiooxydans TaxID=392484 RepID=A0A0A0BGP9_9GAMM|nr:hypothetical protein LP43_2117 [Methylophaga thiooxydans]